MSDKEQRDEFAENVELDATCVAAAMQGGLHAMLSAALASGCPSPDAAMRRAEWLKRQPPKYIDTVCERVAEIGKAMQ